MNLDQYHPTVKTIIELLKKNDCWFEVFEHEAVVTSEQAAQIRTGYSLSQGAKALILSVKNSQKESSFIQVVLPGDRKLDSKAVGAFLSLKSLRFATADEISKLTDDIKIGGIPPFGILWNVPVYLDNTLLTHEKIIFNAGDQRFSIGMKTADYIKVVKPIIGSYIIQE